MTFIHLNEKKKIFSIILLILTFSTSTKSPKSAKTTEVLNNPLLFSLVVPPLNNAFFGHQLETFGNHKTAMKDAPRGGDLCLMDTQGNVRFLTREAGFGVASGEIQEANAIAVRQPCVHWDGNKALFSMVIGGPIKAFDQSYRENKWQIYEITNLEEVIAGQVANIVRVPNQPNYNNISPIYGSDDQILFTSDKPLFNMENTYPQMDEYESTETNTGIFKLNPVTGNIIHLTHSPSGDFEIQLASDGRITSTRWEHLKRDQQADHHRYSGIAWGPVNYDSENEDAEIINGPEMKDGKPFADADGTPYEIFPEARTELDPTKDPNEAIHNFNQFLPWEITENGERHQTMNHAGRHEFGGGFLSGSKLDDPNLDFRMTEHAQNPVRTFIGSAGIFQIKEDPRAGKEGTFYGTWAREFQRFSSGRILEFSLPIGANPEEMIVKDWTHESIDNSANTKGHFRNPLMLLNGKMMVSYTPESEPFNSDHKYHFQIAFMEKMSADPNDNEHTAGAPLTGEGIEREIVYWGDFSTPLSVMVKMNEVEVVEIIKKNRPTARPTFEIADIEKQVLDEEGVNETTLRTWLQDNNLALIVIRNITERDRGEIQQPFNLSVPGGVSTVPASGKVYDISHFQIFSAELLRSYKLRNLRGRRVLATLLRNTTQHPTIMETNLIDPDGPESSVKISLDGSVAAFVPATRALTWQTLAPDGEEIVRERQWLTFAPGEIRTCEGCHGINKETHAGNPVPQNKPQALRELMKAWKNDFKGTVTGAIDQYIEEMQDVVLYQNFPNPFNQTTKIEYKVNNASDISLKVFNSMGQEVVELDHGFKQIGKYEVLWDRRDNYGKTTNVGIYFYQLKANGKTISKKFISQQ